MAVRVFQFSVVFAIGFCFGPAAGSAVATGVTEIPLSLHLKNPKDVTVARSQSATLKCEAESSASGSNVSWSWQYEGKPILSSDPRRKILADGSLYIPKVAGKKMEGQYQCLAKNDVGAVLSNPAKLKIATIREFIEQPKNVSVAEQQPILLPCRIQSIPNALIHWERDNKPLPHSTRYVPLPLGALLITSTHSSDAGFYRCIATNKLLNKKTKRSKTGQLTVLPPPRSTEPPKFLPLGLEPNITILVGNNLTLYCAVTGWPKPTIQWLYNMSILVGNSSILELRNVSGYATGNYRCSAYNTEGHTTMHYQVQVEEPPHFNVTPVSISYPSARTVRLDCQVKGTPQPKISWLKNGQKLQPVGRIKLQPSGLVLSHSFTTDAGVYQCVAVNSAGRAWVSAQLVPYFSENRPSPPQNVQCRSFDESSICLIWDPPANVTIQAYSIHTFRAVPSIGVGIQDFVTNYTYQLASGLDSSTNYTFYVRSYSKEASDQSNNVSCETGIKGKRNLIIEYISETSVKLSWSEISNDIPCGKTATIYKVQWRRVDQSSVNVEQTKGLKKVVSGLRPSATYEFRVQSTSNKNGESPWVSFSLNKEKSSSEIVTTSDYSGILELNDTSAVPFTPQQVEADPLSPYSINLTWMNAEEDEEVFYTVCCVEVREEKSCENGQLIKSERNYVEVNNLKPNTMYEFKVRAQSFKGNFSPFSHSVQVQTFVDIPSPVQDLKCRVINTTTVCIRWQAPLHKNGKLTKYVVIYTDDPNLPLEKWPRVDVNASQSVVKNCWPIEEEAISVVLTKLQPNTQYTVTVTAATEAGFSNSIRPITFSTKDTLAISFYPDVEEEEPPGSDNQDELHYKQKLGVALGVLISILCILCCVSCIIFRRRCVKREALARARLAASNNYYPSSTGAPYPSTSVQLRHQESCAAEAHEMQHLVGEEGSTHIPPITPTHLDTKGGVGFPNGQLNGSLKHAHMNGHIANGHVHITENPRYDFHDCNGHINPRKASKQESLLPSFKNCARRKDRHSLDEDFRNSKHTPSLDESQGIAPYDIPQTNNAQSSEISNSKQNNPRENGKLSEIRKISDYNSNCNSVPDDLYKFRSSSPPMNEVLDSSNGLNVTQLTCLDDSFASQRRISPALGPNG